MSAAVEPVRTLRHDRMTIALHWVIGIALLAEVAFGFLLDDLAPRGTPARAGVITLHKSIGVVLGVLIAVRLVWRLTHRPPDWPASMPAWQQRSALWGHRALYACMIVMPTAGYVASNFSKHGIRFFGIVMRPWGPDLPAVYAFLSSVHVVTAWLFCVLIAGHTLIALKHGFVDHDGMLSRIWPFGRNSA